MNDHRKQKRKRLELPSDCEEPDAKRQRLSLDDNYSIGEEWSDEEESEDCDEEPHIIRQAACFYRQVDSEHAQMSKMDSHFTMCY